MTSVVRLGDLSSFGLLASSSATKNLYLAIDSLLDYSMVPNCASSAQSIIYPCCSNIKQGQMILYVFDVERILWLLLNTCILSFYHDENEIVHLCFIISISVVSFTDKNCNLIQNGQICEVYETLSQRMGK